MPKMAQGLRPDIFLAEHLGRSRCDVGENCSAQDHEIAVFREGAANEEDGVYRTAPDSQEKSRSA